MKIYIINDTVRPNLYGTHLIVNRLGWKVVPAAYKIYDLNGTLMKSHTSHNLDVFVVYNPTNFLTNIVFFDNYNHKGIVL